MKSEVYALSELVILFDKKRIPLSAMERVKRSGSYRYYGAQGVIDYIDDYIFDGQYMLIAEDGENLKSNKQNIAQLVSGRFWLNNHAHIVQCNEKANMTLLCYYLNHTDLSGYITGSAQPKLSQTNLNAITVRLPGRTIQDRIASIIDSIDGKIASNTQINHNLEQQCDASYRRLFVDEANPDWLVSTISGLGDVIGGSTPSKARPEYYCEDGIAWITPKDLSLCKNKFISHGADDITPLGLENSSARIMPRGTVLFSSRAPIGYIAIAKNDVCTNQGFKSIVPFTHIGTAFVYFFLKNNLEAIEGRASGSTFKEVSGSIMKSIPATIPDSALLKQFNEFCAAAFHQQEILEGENSNLATLRDALLPKLMSGELDVSEVDI